jgi:4Fe-4S ferredoxin
MNKTSLRDAEPRGKGCEPEARRLGPVINPDRCEAKSDCVAVCPYDVFEVRNLSAQELRALPFLTQLRVRLHGGRQAFVTSPQKCHACGLCVAACPETAIRLVKTVAG